MCLQKHFEPKPVVIVRRFHFYRRNQTLGQTVTEYLPAVSPGYALEVRGLPRRGPIRDKLVCGLKNKGVQKRLLTYSDLTLVKVIEVTQSMEAAEIHRR